LLSAGDAPAAAPAMLLHVVLQPPQRERVPLAPQPPAVHARRVRSALDVAKRIWGCNPLLRSCPLSAAPARAGAFSAPARGNPGPAAARPGGLGPGSGRAGVPRRAGAAAAGGRAGGAGRRRAGPGRRRRQVGRVPGLVRKGPAHAQAGARAAPPRSADGTAPGLGAGPRQRGAKCAAGVLRVIVCVRLGPGWMVRPCLLVRASLPPRQALW
jgi:hypothetical protein